MLPNPQIHGICSHLLNNSLMENFIFCAVLRLQAGSFRVHQIFKPKNVFFSRTTLQTSQRQP